MIISKYVENREKYRDNKLEGLISSVEMLLS